MVTTIQAAIDSALAQNWLTAIKLNKELIKNNKDDIDSLARLAYALTQINDLEKAKKIYKKILSLDKYNSLAQKNLDKIINIPKGSSAKQTKERVSPGLFIEEPGKTKVIQLVNLAPNKILSSLNIGETVNIHPKKHSVEIRGMDKSYYGALPDDIAFRLIKFIAAGNTYIACIKNVQKNSVTIFVRELSRGKKFSYLSTFTPIASKEYSASVNREIKKTLLEENEEEETQEEPEE